MCFALAPLLCRQDSCCTGRIRDSGMVCSDTQAAPCVIDDEGASVKAAGKPLLGGSFPIVLKRSDVRCLGNKFFAAL